MKEATEPKIPKVTAIPAAMARESLNDFFLSAPTAPTQARSIGTEAREHGVKDVTMPAKRLNTGAAHRFSAISPVSVFIISVI